MTANFLRAKPAAIVLLAFALVGCPGQKAKPSATTLVEARKSFKTQLRSDFFTLRTPAAEPPAGAPFRKVSYEGPPGKLAAYLTPDPGDGKKHPAIVWITGGDCNSLDEVWKEARPENDQTASAYRKGGLVMMFPSLRGGNDNPGQKEGFLGEVDDVLAAAKHLAAQTYVDPKRIYLGGHSTGGTLALLVAAAAPPDTFRAVFSFGPVADLDRYPDTLIPFPRTEAEYAVRSPARFLQWIQTPTFIFEGTREGNLRSLEDIKRSNDNPRVKCFAVRGANHFTVLAPTNATIVERLIRDDAAKPCEIAFSEDDLSAPFAEKSK